MVNTKGKRWKSKWVDNRDWKIYHEELITKGEFFFDFGFLENWDSELKEMNKGKRGAPYMYPESLFYWLSPMYSFLSSRKLEGSLNELSYYIKKLKSCDHSTIIERLNELGPDLNVDKRRSYKTATDSTGEKVTNRGEYISKKWQVQRGWVKVSIMIDRFTNELLDVEVALDSKASDPDLAKKHLDNLQDVKIEDFAGDGAYYEKELYRTLQSRDIQPVIKIPKGASKNGFDFMHSCVREIHELGGYGAWRDKYKYGHRWNSESYNSSTKRAFGETLRMHKEENCLKEAKMKFINHERMQKYAKNRVKT